MVIFDEWAEKYEKAFPDDDLALEYFGIERTSEVIAKFERSFRENKPLTVLYPEIKKFCDMIINKRIYIF